METNRLRQFCVICETQNLRQAAEMLSLSHSALSKSMKVLQSETNLQLLTQHGRGIQVTDVGQRFYLKAQDFLKKEQELLSSELVLAPVNRIGTFEIFSTYLLAGTWQKHFQDRPMELRELLPGKIETALINHEIDVGITYEPIPTAGLDFLKIGKITLGIFIASEKLRKFPFAELPFVAPVSPINSIPTGPKGLDGWPEDHFPRKILYRVDMMESALALARSGQAAVFIPKFIAKLHNQRVGSDGKLSEISHADLFKPIQRTIYLVKRQSTIENKLVKELSRLIRLECL